MKIKWLNSFGLILFFFLINLHDASKIQFSAELHSDLVNFHHQDMWHPHLKRRWLDDKNYVIYDNRRKAFPTSLVQLSTAGGFLSEDKKNHAKMNCGCRFLKKDIVGASSPGKSSSSSFLELKSNVSSNDIQEVAHPKKNSFVPVNSYMESLAQNINYNNMIMSKIEHLLESQHTQVPAPFNPMMNQMGNNFFNPMNMPMNMNMNMINPNQINQFGNNFGQMGQMGQMGNYNFNNMMNMNPMSINNMLNQPQIPQIPQIRQNPQIPQFPQMQMINGNMNMFPGAYMNGNLAANPMMNNMRLNY